MTDNPFIKRDRWDVPFVDVAAFAAALSAAMGGTLTQAEEGPYGVGRFTVDGIEFWMRRDKGDKVAVGASAGGLARQLHHSDRISWPSACISTARPIERLAADVTRRVLAPARECLEVTRAKVAEVEQRAADLMRHVEALRAACPWLDVDPRIEPGQCEAKVWGWGDPYLTGRLYADGKLGIDRVAPLDNDRALAVLRALAPSEGRAND